MKRHENMKMPKSTLRGYRGGINQGRRYVIDVVAVADSTAGRGHSDRRKPSGLLPGILRGIVRSVHMRSRDNCFF